MTDATAHAPSSPVEDLLEHAGFLRGIVRVLLSDEASVDDVLQDTWTVALEKPPRRAENVRGWLGVVARNLALKRRRGDARRAARERAAARLEGPPSPDAVVATLEWQRRLVDAVLRLDPEARALIVGRFHEGATVGDLARRAGVTPRTIARRLHEALATLRADLDREGPRKAWTVALGAPLLEAPAPSGEIGLATRLAFAALAVALTIGVFLAATSASKGAAPQAIPPGDPSLSLPAPPPSDPVADPTVWPEDCPAASALPPHIAIDLPPEGLDLGAVRQGVRVERGVTIRNRGRGTLCLRKPTVGCGCIRVSLVGPTTLEPGESVEMTVVLDTNGRDGVVRKSVSVPSNDPETPVAVFTVRAEVSKGLIAGAARVEFVVRTDLPRGTAELEAVARVRLRSPKDDPEWGVTAVEDAAPGGTALAHETKALDDPVWRVVEITVRRAADRGQAVVGRLRIRTTHPDRPEVVLPYFLPPVSPASGSPLAPK